MDGLDVTHAGAAVAGLLSFVSPCVLPLVPAYLCFLGGATLDRLAADTVDRMLARRVFWAALAFVLGFSTVFIALGATATAAGKLLAQNMGWLAKIAGAVIVVFGLHYMGVFRIAFLNFEKRFHMQSQPAGLVGSYLLGLAFAFGWTPCVGPVLATILMVAAGGESVAGGVSLLAAYAAGLGLPFLAAALAVRPFMGLMKRLRGSMRTIELAMGVLLVITGALIFLGSLANVGQWLMDSFPIFSRLG